MSHLTVRDVMTTDVLSVGESASMRDIVGLFAMRNIGAVPIVRSGQVVGIVTHADVLPLLGFPTAPLFLDPSEAPPRDLLRLSAGKVAADVMSAPVVTVHADNSLIAAARLMTSHHLRRMPVVDDAGHLVGIVTRGDLVRRLASVTEEAIPVG